MGTPGVPQEISRAVDIMHIKKFQLARFIPVCESSFFVWSLRGK
jgi:hypothetical protein